MLIHEINQSAPRASVNMIMRLINQQQKQQQQAQKNNGKSLFKWRPRQRTVADDEL